MSGKDEIANIYRRIAEENEKHDRAFQRGREELLRNQGWQSSSEQLQQRKKAGAE